MAFLGKLNSGFQKKSPVCKCEIRQLLQCFAQPLKNKGTAPQPEQPPGIFSAVGEQFRL